MQHLNGTNMLSWMLKKYDIMKNIGIDYNNIKVVKKWHKNKVEVEKCAYKIFCNDEFDQKCTSINKCSGKQDCPFLRSKMHDDLAC